VLRVLVSCCCFAAVVLGWGGFVVPDAGARTLHTVLQDDDLALFSPPRLPGFIQELRWLGVDELRVSAEWKLEVPNPDLRRRPAGFRPSDPGSYTGLGMRALDSAVRAAVASGISVLIDPAFSAPLWATSDRAPAHPSASDWFNSNIDVREAAGWEQMLAHRYNGSYTPAGERTPLPRVATFTLWNEPNNASFLKPQWQGAVPVSADWYRSLVRLAYPAIKRVNPQATVLIGNTSFAGGERQMSSGGVAPLAFIRRLACVDAQLRPLREPACAAFSAIPADGFAHHPYERDAAPWLPSGPKEAGWAQMGDLPRLQALLDELVATHRLAPGAGDLWLTEQGYESNAELTDRPWTEAQQAQLNAYSEYVAWRDPHVLAFSQFLLRDTRTAATLALRARTHKPTANLSGTWTTGLRREDGQAKPALWMFRSPVVARIIPTTSSPFATGLRRLLGGSAPRILEVWGRARPLRSAGTVEVQLSPVPGSEFRTVTAVPTDANGIFDVSVAVPAEPSTRVRFRWRSSDGAWQTSPSTVA